MREKNQIKKKQTKQKEKKKNKLNKIHHASFVTVYVTVKGSDDVCDHR